MHPRAPVPIHMMVALARLLWPNSHEVAPANWAAEKNISFSGNIKWYVLGFWSTKWLNLMSGQVYVLQLLECFSIMFRHSNVLTTGLVPWTHQWFHIETFAHWFPSFCTLIGFLYHSVGSVLMFFSPMSAPFFGGDVGYITVYKMVEPNNCLQNGWT